MIPRMICVNVLYALAEQIYGIAARTWIPAHDASYGLVLALGPYSSAPRRIETEPERVLKGMIQQGERWNVRHREGAER